MKFGNRPQTYNMPPGIRRALAKADSRGLTPAEERIWKGVEAQIARAREVRAAYKQHEQLLDAEEAA